MIKLPVRREIKREIRARLIEGRKGDDCENRVRDPNFIVRDLVASSTQYP